MTIIERVKNICLTPKTEWPVIAGEPTLVGGHHYRVRRPARRCRRCCRIRRSVADWSGHASSSEPSACQSSPVWSRPWSSFVGAIVAVFIVSLIINGLAPTFGAEKNSSMAMKVAAYSYTPALAAGVLRVLPALGTLVILAALYGLYLLYLGLQSLMKSPPDKAAGYTAVVVVVRHRLHAGRRCRRGGGRRGRRARGRPADQGRRRRLGGGSSSTSSRGAVRQEQHARQAAGAWQEDGREQQED